MKWESGLSEGELVPLPSLYLLPVLGGLCYPGCPEGSQ